MFTNLPLSTLRISIVDMISLHVRAKGSGSSPPPDFLYQNVPTNAMALLATLPRGTSAVSIPHRKGLGNGHRILKSPPPTTDGFVIVYARKPNGRYEATKVLFRGKAFGISEFHEIAQQWVAEHEGSLRTIPGRYAYFAPSIDLWGVVLRDNGYIAVDLLKIPPDTVPELGESRKNVFSAGIIARASIRAGERQPTGVALPAFARVESTFDPHPGPQSLWMNFAEYRKARTLRSCPPDSIIPDFLEWLSLFTMESGMTHWIFRRGMFFGDRIEWWGNRVRRRTEHEGLDFAEGAQSEASIRSIREGVPVRAMVDGEIVAILNDFLGRTVVVRHPAITDGTGDVFYTLLSHIQPIVLQLGSVVKGQLIGRVAKLTNVSTPVHLHLSGAWIPQAIRPDEISFNHINPAFTPVGLINFNDLIQGSPLVRLEDEPNLPLVDAVQETTADFEKSVKP
jgi:murein DD-endopeptidase MepM/ murein hydrolase activator NlpD